MTFVLGTSYFVRGLSGRSDDAIRKSSGIGNGPANQNPGLCRRGPARPGLRLGSHGTQALSELPAVDVGHLGCSGGDTADALPLQIVCDGVQGASPTSTLAADSLLRPALLRLNRLALAPCRRASV